MGFMKHIAGEKLYHNTHFITKVDILTIHITQLALL